MTCFRDINAVTNVLHYSVVVRDDDGLILFGVLGVKVRCVCPFGLSSQGDGAMPRTT